MGGKTVQKKIEKPQQERLQTKQLPGESLQDFKQRLKVEARAKMQELNRKVSGRAQEKRKENQKKKKEKLAAKDQDKLEEQAERADPTERVRFGEVVDAPLP